MLAGLQFQRDRRDYYAWYNGDHRDKWLRAERAYMLCHLVCAGDFFMRHP